MIDEAKIRERAYELWELHGQQEGMEAEHWRQAIAQLEAEKKTAECSTLDSVSSSGQSGIAQMPVDQPVD
jgi:hypothetical protein